MKSKLFIDSNIVSGFDKPIIFYLVNNNDTTNFFITFALLDFNKKEISYLFSYSDENIECVKNHPNNEMFNIFKVPHCAISIEQNKELLVFMQEEEFFLHINIEKNILTVYTINDLLKDNTIEYKKITSTLFKDNIDENYFYLSVVDENNIIHIFRISLKLDEIEEIYSLIGKSDPPHVLKKYKNFLLLSHEFNDAKFKLTKTDKVVNSEELAMIFQRNKMRLKMIDNDTDINDANIDLLRNKLLHDLKDKYLIDCVNGKVILLNLDSKDVKYYTTSGGSPAHFEIDEQSNTIYISSHNFFNRKDSMTFIKPAVLDKFILENDEMILLKSFTYEKGYRFASHRVFRYNNKIYICTIAHPNRIMFIDAENMELLFYEDIEDDELSNINNDLDIYLSTRKNKFQIVPIEVSANGENIIFMSNEHIYIYNFPKRIVTAKLEYKQSSINANDFNNKLSLNNYRLQAVHINYID